MAKKPYDYHEELPNSLHFGNINFEKKSIMGIAKLWSNLANKKIQNYSSLYGNTVKKLFIPISDGTILLCYVIEPSNADENLPAIVYYHGGGFMFKLQEMMFRNADLYVKELRCRVFLPEYRVTPDANCPSILKDSYESLEYICKNSQEFKVDLSQVIVYGDSAGGCLAASVAQMCKEQQKPSIKAQMLIYPATDNSSATPSMTEYKDAVWSRSANIHMWNLYLKDYSELEKFAVPMKFYDFSDLPQAYIEAAEMDSLRDDGLLYAEKLKKAGVETQMHVIKRAYHGFDSNFNASLTKEALKLRIEYLKKVIYENLTI